MIFIEDKFIFISKIRNFKDKNKRIIDVINKLSHKELLSGNERVTKTDWDIKNSKKDYFFHIDFDIDKHLEKQSAILGNVSVEIDNVWYQQYSTNSSHGWHTHAGAHFSNVYFVECEEGQQTEFKNFKIDVQEGDLISFPAFLPHQSKEIKSGRKTVIAFNTVFHGS